VLARDHSIVVADSLQLAAPAREDIAPRCEGRTRAGKPCRNRPMRGRTVCKQHSGDVDIGQRSKLTADVQARIFQALASGCGIEKAAAHATVGVRTVYEWMERGLADQEAGNDTEFSQFSQGVTRTRANLHIRLAARIQQAGAGGDWRADAWLLERLAPAEFGQKAMVDHHVSREIDVTDMLGGRQPVEVPREKRERMIAILLEDEDEPVDATVVG
jgi:transposase